MSKLYLKPQKKFILPFSIMVAVVVMLALPALTQAQGPTGQDASLVSGTDGQNGPVYRFTNVTTNERDIDAARMYSFWFKSFVYKAPAQSPLPVVLSSFTAKKTGNQVLLNWITDMEKNVSHFVIEKSLNGKDFTDAGLLFTEGDSDVRKEYNFKNELRNITSALVYYRLKIVDLDGKYKQSTVRLIRVTEDNAAKSVAIYPNPAVSGG